VLPSPAAGRPGGSTANYAGGPPTVGGSRLQVTLHAGAGHEGECRW